MKYHWIINSRTEMISKEKIELDIDTLTPRYNKIEI